MKMLVAKVALLSTFALGILVGAPMIGPESAEARMDPLEVCVEIIDSGGTWYLCWIMDI